MCAVSMIIDHHRDDWNERFRRPADWKYTPDSADAYRDLADRQDLQRRIEELEALVKKARIYDETTNQRDCEMESKKEALRKLAMLWGLEINFEV